MKTLWLLCFGALACASLRAGEVSEVPKGSALRSELFDLARPRAEKVAGQPVKFEGSLKRQGDWAFFSGSIVDGDGSPIAVGGAPSADTCVLWRRVSGNWKVVKALFGITDVAYISWPEELGVPHELLGL